MNLVIFKLNHLGDNVVFLPVVQTLRTRFPDWQITLLTTPTEAALYTSTVPPAELLTSSKDHFDHCWRRPWELAAWLWRVRRRQPDACLISFDQANVAHLIARHSGARVRIGANLQHIRVARSVTHEVPMPADTCPATWHWEMARVLVRTLGVDDWPARPPPPDLSHLVGPRPPSAPRPHIVVHAGSNQTINRWPSDRFAALANRLARDHDVTWIDRPDTRGESLGPTVRRHAPSDLRDFATLLAGADLFLGNNSGPMHVANALGTAGVIVVGPSALGWDPFWHRERWRVLRDRTLPCVPCGRPDKVVTTCALTENPLACLRHWSIDAVEAECRTALAHQRSVPRPAGP